MALPGVSSIVTHFHNQLENPKMLMLLKKIRKSIRNHHFDGTLAKLHPRHLSLAVLLTEVLGSVDHVSEGTLDLIPLAGLQTAVRVDPKLLRADCVASLVYPIFVWVEAVVLTVLKHLLDALLELGLGRDTRAVDVIDTRANVARVGLVNEDLEELGIGLGVLDGENVGIQRGDGCEIGQHG